MARNRSSYRRKLSAEEAREQYIFVTKDALEFFPPLEQPFELAVGDTPLRVGLSAVDCSCVGQPHQHYRIEAGELAALVEFSRGSVFTIARDETGAYSLLLANAHP